MVEILYGQENVIVYRWKKDKGEWIDAGRGAFRIYKSEQGVVWLGLIQPGGRNVLSGANLAVITELTTFWANGEILRINILMEDGTGQKLAIKPLNCDMELAKDGEEGYSEEQDEIPGTRSDIPTDNADLVENPGTSGSEIRSDIPTDSADLVENAGSTNDDNQTEPENEEIREDKKPPRNPFSSAKEVTVSFADIVIRILKATIKPKESSPSLSENLEDSSTLS